MGVMIGFVLGYVVGTRSGAEGFEEMTSALKSILSSGELKELAGGAIGMVGDLLKQGTGALGDGGDTKLRRIA
ncbi:MAG TPA: hypothetical protein VJ653_02190 [Acidimicrobiales bacterium]|nr:hypothetical protein [Acidimicrobiales bacterium]